MYAKIKIIVLLSLLGVLMPFLGIPITWRVWISAFLALAVSVLAYYALRTLHAKERLTGENQQSDSLYVDRQPRTEISHTENQDTHAA